MTGWVDTHMPLKKDDLPGTLQRSPRKCRTPTPRRSTVAEETYDGDEERAHRTAWASVKHIAEKKGDHWELKDEKGPSDPQAERAARRRATTRARRPAA